MAIVVTWDAGPREVNMSCWGSWALDGGWVCSMPGHPKAVGTLPIFFSKNFQESLHKSRYWVVGVLESNGEPITSLLWFPVLADNVFVAGVMFSQQGYPQANSENCLYERDTDELPFLQSLNKTVVSQNHLPGGLFYQNRLSQHVRIHQIRKAENSGLWIRPLRIKTSIYFLVLLKIMKNHIVHLCPWYTINS